MFLKTPFLLFFLLCTLTLWCKSASAGSSFLSPSQKPQTKGKTVRYSRHAMEEPGQPTEDKHISVSAPFEISMMLTEEEFEEYSLVLQEIVQHLRDRETAEYKDLLDI
uniref:Motilin/ghrelin-associated peptide domain-containing protein n=1 Tax=Salarias fasciatus TaxID=181472 RepID=A0A672JQL7_SALFA